jgi:protein-disulfide isomerase
LRQIDEAYVAKGIVRFGYAHFAFLGQESLWAAEASECAGDQEAFWPYHDYLYGHQAGENGGGFSQEKLKQFASELGLDSQAFNTCLDSGKYAALVKEQTATGQSLGMRGTPSFLVNGQLLVGALPFEEFERTIEAAK